VFPEILEEILGSLEEQWLATRAEVRRIREVLEGRYGVYPVEALRDWASVVAERRETYMAVRRLYTVRPLGGLADVRASDRPNAPVEPPPAAECRSRRRRVTAADLGRAGAEALQARGRTTLTATPRLSIQDDVCP